MKNQRFNLIFHFYAVSTCQKECKSEKSCNFASCRIYLKIRFSTLSPKNFKRWY
jgi:hypothetical protein